MATFRVAPKESFQSRSRNGLRAFANLIATGVNELVGYLGATTPGGNVLQAYKQAVAEKFGSDSSPPSPSSVGDATGASIDPMTGASVTPQSSSSFRITSYGYEKPGDPNYDSNSANGIGAFSFDSEPGSLGTSMAPPRSLLTSPKPTM
jgi:hypothetical protein